METNNRLIDAHVHLITASMVSDVKQRMETQYPEYREGIRSNSQRLLNPAFIQYLSGRTIKDHAATWLEAMDNDGIRRAVFFPISEQLEEMRDFINVAPDRFWGYAFLDTPQNPSAAETLRKAVVEFGLKGLKLYPPIQLFNPSDKALFPLYEEASSLGIPITFHFGITLAPVADYRFINPIDLQLASRLFPRLNFIIAHFGAGYFREVCLLGFHSTNIYLDTSGTNNWRDYTPERMPLLEIFRRSVEIFSAERILFGTDTVMRPDAGYRTAIMKEQKGIVETLPLSDAERGLLLWGNAERLFEKR